MKRTRVVATVLLLLNGMSIAAAVYFGHGRQPTEHLRQEATYAEFQRAGAEALAAHPFGDLLVPYEHDKISEALAHPMTTEEWDHEKSYLVGGVHVFYIVLGEMTWLVVGMYTLGLIGACMALSGKRGWVIGGAVVMLLAAPVPVVSVGPQSVVLTSYLLVGGVVLLLVKPSARAMDLSAAQVADARRSAWTLVWTGLIELALGAVGLAVALGMGRASAKLWIGIVGCGVAGVVSIVWGLATLPGRGGARG